MKFISVSIKKINSLISHRDFIGFISVGHDAVELDFGSKIATVGFMGAVFWSEKE